MLVLEGGRDFWSNGIHLNVIEAADSPADESWRNIVAIDDLTQALIEATDCLVVAAMQGNAGSTPQPTMARAIRCDSPRTTRHNAALSSIGVAGPRSSPKAT